MFHMLLLLTALAPTAPRVVVQTGHAAPHEASAYSPDGALFASAGGDVIIWETTTDRAIRVVRGHNPRGVEGLGFSHDGKTVASVSLGTLIVTSVADDTDDVVIKSDMIGAMFNDALLGFTEDDSAVVTANGGAVVAWEWRTGKHKVIAKIRNDDDYLGVRGMNKRGTLIAVGRGKSVDLFDVGGRKLRTAALSASVYGSGGSFTADDALLVVSCGDPQHLDVCVVDVASGKQARRFKVAQATLEHLDVDSTSHRIAVTDIKNGELGEVGIYDLDTGARTSTIAVDKFTQSAIFDTTGTLLGIGSTTSQSDSTVRVWDLQRGADRWVKDPSPLGTGTVRVSPRGDAFAAVGDHVLCFYRMSDGGERACSVPHQKVDYEPNTVALADDLSVLANGRATSIRDNHVKLWDLKQGRIIDVFGKRGPFGGNVDFGRARALAVTRDGTRVVLTSTENTLRERFRVLDVATRKEVCQAAETVGGGVEAILAPHAGLIAISPDGTRAAVPASFHGDIFIYDTRDCRLLTSVKAEGDGHLALDWSDDGRRLVTAERRGRVRVLASDTLRVQKTLNGFKDGAHSAVFAGGTIFIGDGTGKISAFDAKSFAPKKMLARAHEGAVSSLAATRDGASLTSGGCDGHVRTWDLVGGALAARGDRHVGGGCLSVAHAGVDRIVGAWSAAQGITLLDRAGVQPLATLFTLSEDDWVVVDNAGRFDGSAAGQKRVSLVDGVRPLPLDSFFERLFTPRLLVQALSGAPPPVAAPIPTRFAPPPTIRILSPATQTHTSATEIEITVEATDAGGGVDEVRVYLGGKVMGGETRGFKRAAGSATQKIMVPLASGANTVRVTGFSRERTESTGAEIVVVRDAPSARADLYVLAVGINEYKNPRYRLNYGRPDAEALAASVQKGGARIFANISVRTVLDGAATRGALEAAFADIAARARPDDVFVFFWAGHGVMGDEAGADYYLVPHDVTQLYGDPKQLADKALSSARLRELIGSVKAQKQLVLLDACQSGGAVKQFAMRGAAEEGAIHQLARSTGVVMIAASDSAQFATELERLRHGVFTYALLAALAGEADVGGDGKITVKEIEAYLNDRVPELTQEHRGRPQFPTSFGYGQDFPVATK